MCIRDRIRTGVTVVIVAALVSTVLDVYKRQVFVMPSKAYPGNPYYDKIKEVFGKIPVYEH